MTEPFDNGVTLYTVTIQFSNDYPPIDDEGHPLHWHWADLLDEPDARCISIIEGPNPEWGNPASQRDVVIAQADRMMAERDYYAGRLAAITGEDYTPEPGTVWTLPEAVQA
jgi:hypothetical protein